jgi:CheY-like chemotaxis protein
MKSIAAVGGELRGMTKLEPRVFVVDDDQSVRTSLANLLAAEDCAAEYLARVPHLGPACLVLDVRLPGLDGLNLQRQLAEEGRMERIVFITGYGDIPMGIGAMKRGAVNRIWRPACVFSPGLIRIPLGSFNKAPLQKISALYSLNPTINLRIHSNSRSPIIDSSNLSA